MSLPENPPQKIPAEAPNLVGAEASAASPGFEETLHRIWTQYGRMIVAACVVVLLVILGNGVFNYLAAQKEVDIRQAFAVADTPEKLKAFAAANSGHPLAGVATLQAADVAYTAGQGAEAATQYEAAAKILAGTAFAGRAQLGRAMALLLAGRTAEGEAALQQLAGRTTESSGVRSEAAYLLATLAQTAGRTDQVRQLTDQILQIDPASTWAQRALLLASDPAASAPAQPASQATETSPSDTVIRLNLPGGN
jgi:hypothetical protein